MASGNTWSVFAAPVGHTSSTTVTAYVACLRGAPAAVVLQASESVSLPAGGANGRSATCPVGTVLTGWGFSSPTSTVEIDRSISTGNYATQWSFVFLSHDFGPQTVTVAVQCLKNLQASQTVATAEAITIGANSTGSNQMSCPAGTAVTAGGYSAYELATANDYMGTPYSLRASANGWQAAMFAPADLGLFASTVCLSFS
jgi:hypothetical protein